ncbi:hypothetical protein D3C71_1584420 [compost metagenome]
MNAWKTCGTSAVTSRITSTPAVRARSANWVESSRSTSLVPTCSSSGGNPVRSANLAGLTSSWFGSCPARYIASVYVKLSRVKNGSSPILLSILAPECVLSKPAENVTTAAGIGRSASRTIRQVETAIPPPAESPANTIDFASTPSSNNPR